MWSYKLSQQRENMFCAECGSKLKQNVKFCPKCGTMVKSARDEPKESSNILQPEIALSRAIEFESKLGTKWLKFWNYVSLPAGGIFGILIALGTPALAIITLPYAVLQFLVAYGLHNRRLWAWKWNWVLIVFLYIGNLIPEPLSGTTNSPTELGIQFVARLVLMSLIWMWPNYVYWKKRKVLFR